MILASSRIRTPSSLLRRLFGLLVLAICATRLLGAAFATVPTPPGGPILVVTSSTATFGTYYAEILRNEGFNEYAVSDIGALDASTLASYDVVILAKTPALSGPQVTMFTNWVNAGGNLIAMSPDPALSPLLGLTGPAGVLSDGYLLIDTTTKVGNGLVDQTIQFHGSASRYTLNGAVSLATLYSSASAATANPAVTLNTVGTGRAAAFTYDLATSVVYTRQGNPAWATQERDGQAPIRSDDQYYGNAASDPKPDWVDLSKVAIPQADEQQRLLANLIVTMNSSRKPLPRFWYFPNGKKAVVIMTGDDHANGGTAGRFDQFIAASPAGCNLANWECVRGTSYLYPGGPLTDQQAQTYSAAGFEIGVHVTTNCVDFTSTADLDSFYTRQIAAWAAQYPSLPTPVTERVHCLAWSDWSSEPQVELSHGMRLDTSYYYWPPNWIQNRPGVFTGSALPMRFAKLDGNLLDVYQATSQMTDESGQTFPFTIDTLLDRAIGEQGYYGAYTVNAHTDQADSDVANAVVASAQARGVPIVSSAQMLNWLDGRNSSSFGGFAWNGSALTFTIAPGPNTTGLQAMVPIQAGAAGLLTTVKRSDNSGVAYTTATIKGIEYATFSAAAGTYVLTYAGDTTPPTVIGTTPADGATGVSVSASMTATFSEAMDPSTITTGTLELRGPGGSLVPSTVAYDAPSATATLTSSSALAASTGYTVRVAGGASGTVARDLAGNALAADFTWTFTTGTGPQCPCSAFVPPNDTPANPSISDANAVELGVKFTSDVAGTITAIRFYKGANNTGQHVAHLWTASGQLLASGTFTNESPTGWQQATLVPAVAISANTVYVASYFAPNGNYATDNGYFAIAGVDTPPLHLLKDGVSGGNGVYAYGASGTFPTNTFNSTNYWVDVVLSSGSGGDTTPPVVTATSPASGATGINTSTTVTATFSEALDSGSVSGSTFKLASGATPVSATVSYNAGVATLAPNGALAAGATYTATVVGGSAGVKDAAGNPLAADFSWSFTTAGATGCCTAFAATATPVTSAASDSAAVEVGVKFKADVAGSIAGIRFYKGSGNTGTHVGNLWTLSGQRLATATFGNETATGWQQVTFATPVAITANTVYVASYFAPAGHYASDAQFFAAGLDNPPLHLLQDGASGGNGVYAYGATSSFPTSTFQSTNYWVDVVFTPAATDTTAPTVTAQAPAPGATGVTTNSVVTATFSEALDPATIVSPAANFQLKAGATSVPATATYDSV
jgi:hypothetical protein